MYSHVNTEKKTFSPSMAELWFYGGIRDNSLSFDLCTIYCYFKYFFFFRQKLLNSLNRNFPDMSSEIWMKCDKWSSRLSFASNLTKVPVKTKKSSVKRNYNVSHCTLRDNSMTEVPSKLSEITTRHYCHDKITRQRWALIKTLHHCTFREFQSHQKGLKATCFVT